MNKQTAEIGYVSDKLVITYLPPTIWPIFPLLLIFFSYFTCLKAREISWENMSNKIKYH